VIEATDTTNHQPRATNAKMHRALFVLALVAGCAHDVRTRFPSAADEPTGTIILAFTKPADDVLVTINGVLVIAGEHTGRVQIDGIPVGTTEIAIAAGPTEKQISIWVNADNPTTIPLGYPGQSMGDTFKGVIVSLASVLLYALIR
jgi:hypothetical protein